MVTKKDTNQSTEMGSYGSLYIPMSDVSEKRKSILKSLKDSLIMQEEYEKIVEVRKSKTAILKEIKKGMDSINSDYQDVKRKLPNVKNVLSFTEKEIYELESQIENLRDNMKLDSEEIKMLSKMSKSGGYKSPEKRSATISRVKKKTEEVSYAPVKKQDSSQISKVDRIKNNLKVIESKLKGL